MRVKPPANYRRPPDDEVRVGDLRPTPRRMVSLQPPQSPLSDVNEGTTQLPRTYVGAPIPSGDRVLLVAERAGHKLRQGIRALDEAEPVLKGTKREPVAGQRRDNDAQAAALTGVRKQVDDLVELPHRAWPAVEEQDRYGIVAVSPLVDEVQIYALQGHAVLLEGVQLRLLRTPVVLVLPVGGELSRVREARPVAPPGARDLVRPARAVQAPPQIGKKRLGQGDPDGFGSSVVYRRR